MLFIDDTGGEPGGDGTKIGHSMQFIDDTGGGEARAVAPE
jgi:hypothetical protein